MKSALSKSGADFSLWCLLATNVLTIYFAMAESWDVGLVVLIYWFQSIAIGFINILRILRLKSFGKLGLILNGKFLTEATPEARWTLAIFFFVHYGFFHIVFLVILLGNMDFDRLWEYASRDGIRLFFVGILAFIVSEGFAFFYNRTRETTTRNVGSLMLYPYIRIIPMFMIMGAGAAFPGNLLIYFLSLKTASDGIMHIIEQRHLFES